MAAGGSGRAGDLRVGASLRIGGGDVNGFLGLLVDNLSVLALLAAVLIGGFGVPAEIVFGRMFPGTALGVLIGDLAYTWLAVRLARRTGRSDVTAMPFGLDTPSTIGMALLGAGSGVCESFARRDSRRSAAGLETWYLGMAATAIMGAMKLALAFAGRRVQRVIPQAGLLGSLAGIALMLIGFLPVVEILRISDHRNAHPRSCALRVGRKGPGSRPYAGRLVCGHRRYLGVLSFGRLGIGGHGDQGADASDAASRAAASGHRHSARLRGGGGLSATAAAVRAADRGGRRQQCRERPSRRR